MRALFVSLVLSCVFVNSFVAASYGQDTKCVVRPNVDAASQEGLIKWTCSNGGVDCTPIQPGGSHFYPNTTTDHCNWAINEYFQAHKSGGLSECNFDGAAMLQCARNNATGLKEERIYGANIGGFLVLEPWIVPSLFTQFVGKPQNETAIDEYTFTKVLGQVEATKQLTAHWESWVTDSDFQKLESIGVTHVRIPFGYWIFGDVPPFVRGIEQLDRVLDLCKKYNIMALLDLHGAVGSQNGFDNSGRACDIGAGTPGAKYCPIPCPKHAEWGRDANGSTVNQTLATIERVVKRYSNHTAVWGFELVNEPRNINIEVLKNFYERGYRVVRTYAPDRWKVVIHDGFYPYSWSNFMTPSQGYYNVILDTHIYQAFLYGGADYTHEQHFQTSCSNTGMVDWNQCMELPTIVGEWSLGSTDCTKWLDGFGHNPLSSYCGRQPPNMPSNATFLTKYAKLQTSAFYRTLGWFFWNFKTESSPSWNLIHAMDQGWMPPFKPRLPDWAVQACNYSVAP